MVLVPFEPVDPQALQVAGVAMKESTALEDLLQKERVGVIDDADIDFAAMERSLERLLKVGSEAAVFAERRGQPLEKHREVRVTVRMYVPGDRRPELQEKANSVSFRDPLQALHRRGL